MTSGTMGAIGARPAASTGPPVLASAVATWWADDLATADAGSVTSWVDRVSGITLSTLTSAPTMRRTGGANSRPAVEFDGTNNALGVSASDPVSVASQGCVVVVGQVTTPTNGNIVWASSLDTANNRYIYGCCRFPSVGELEIQQTSAGGSDAVRGSTAVPAGTPCLMEWASSGIAYAHRLNNATQTMTASAGSNTGDWFADTPLRNRFTLGAVAYNNSVISYNAMKVSLVMVADAELSSGDRTALTAWVASYYGLTLS